MIAMIAVFMVFPPVWVGAFIKSFMVGRKIFLHETPAFSLHAIFVNSFFSDAATDCGTLVIPVIEGTVAWQSLIVTG